MEKVLRLMFVDDGGTPIHLKTFKMDSVRAKEDLELLLAAHVDSAELVENALWE